MPGKTGVVTLFHTNDFHRRLSPLPNGQGGAARFVGKVRELEAAHPDAITVDLGDVAGDNSVQGPDHFKPIPDLFNRAGIDIMALGNHEFEDSANEYQNLRDGLIKPFQGEVLTANVRHADGRPIEKTKPYLIQQFKDHSIAFVGVVTRELGSAMFPAAGAGLSTLPIEETLRELVPKVKAEGADAVVVLAHANTKEMVEITERVPGIDLTLTAHDHRETEEPLEITRADGSKAWVAEAGAYGSAVGQMDLHFTGRQLTGVEGQLHLVDESAPSDPVANDLVQNFQPLPKARLPKKRKYETVDSFEELAEKLGFNPGKSTPNEHH